MRQRHELRATTLLAAATLWALPGPARAQDEGGGVSSPGFCATLGELIAGACGVAQEDVPPASTAVLAGACTRAAVRGKQLCEVMTPRERRQLLTGVEQVSRFCSTQVRSACEAAAGAGDAAAASCPGLADRTRVVVQALARDVERGR
jgi:hypothetical protein